MPLVRNKKKEVNPLRIDNVNLRGGDVVWLEVHPDGPQVRNGTAILSRIESLQAAQKRVMALKTKRDAGTMDKDEYDEKMAALVKAKENGETNDELYSQTARYLKIALNGTPIAPDEFEKLNIEIAAWEAAAPLKKQCIEYLLAALTAGEFYADDESEAQAETMPITRELLEDDVMFGETRLLLMLNAVKARYDMTDEEGKKLSESLPDASEIKTEKMETSLNGSQDEFLSIEPQKTTAQEVQVQ